MIVKVAYWVKMISIVLRPIKLLWLFIVNMAISLTLFFFVSYRANYN
jgi:hypothetical protein